jgi:hypothetical protein
LFDFVKQQFMRTTLFNLFVAINLSFIVCSCSSLPGKKVKEPFSSSKYQSNNKYFRATGSGESKNQQIAKSKAMTQAKTNLAGNVKSTMKRVADAYIAETGNANGSDMADKFQSLSREVVNQDIADVRTIGSETYSQNDGTYKTYVALEIKKKGMYKVMKKLAKLDTKSDAKTIEEYQKMLDKEIERLEAIEEGSN